MKNILTALFLFVCLSVKAQITPTPITSPRIAFDYFIFQDTTIWGTWAYPFTGSPVVNLRILPGALPTDNTDTKVLSFDAITHNVSLRDAGLLLTTVNSPLSLSGGTLSLLYQMSITSDVSGLKLVNDRTSPGNNYIYATNSVGVKGWRRLEKADFDDLDPYEVVFGDHTSNGNIEQSDNLWYDEWTYGTPLLFMANTFGGFSMSTYADPLSSPAVDGDAGANYGPTGMTFAKDVTFPTASSFTSESWQLGYGAGGVTQGKIYAGAWDAGLGASYIAWYTVGGKTTMMGRTSGGTPYKMLLPNHPGTAGQVLYISSTAVSGTQLNLDWTTPTAEVDSSVTNKGSLTVTSGTASTSLIHSNTSGSTDVTIEAAGTNSISEAGNTITITGTEVDGSTTNELQTVTNTSDATSHTTTLSNSGGSVKLSEGTGVTLTTTGTASDAVVRIATTALLSEVDGSVSNEGSLTVGAGTGSTSVISSNTSGSTDVTLTAAGINTISEVGNVITMTATEVDGSTTNELQTVANTSDATSHTVTLSNSGGSVKLTEGSNISLTTTGTSSDGVVAVAVTGIGSTIQAYDADLDDLADGSLTGSKVANIPNSSLTNSSITFDGVSTSLGGSVTSTGFTIVITGQQGTIADATTYYSGAIIAGVGTTADVNNIPIPVNCVLKSVYVNVLTAGTLATKETSTWAIRKKNTTDITISSTVENSAQKTNFNVTGLSTSFTAGDYVEAKWTTPTWVTNPSNARWTIILYFEKV